MNDLDKLRLQCENLKKAGHKEITLGIDFLIKLLNMSPTAQSVTVTAPPKTKGTVDVDGGGFSD